MSSDFVVIDTETEGLQFHKDKLVCHSFAFNYEEPVTEWFEPGAKYKVTELLRDPQVIKVFHNANFDLLFLNKNIIKTKEPYFDTKIYCAYQNPHRSNRLKDLGEDMGYKVVRLEDIASHTDPKTDDFVKVGMDNTKGFGWVPKKELELYNKQDVMLTRELYSMAIKTGVPEYILNLDFPLIQVLLDMQLKGMKVDRELALKLKGEWSAELAQLDAFFTSKSLNPRSSKQISNYLLKKA